MLRAMIIIWQGQLAVATFTTISLITLNPHLLFLHLKRTIVLTDLSIILLSVSLVNLLAVASIRPQSLCLHSYEHQQLSESTVSSLSFTPFLSPYILSS